MSRKKERILGFGVISASAMAKEHMKAVKFNRNAELRAICDIDMQKAAQAAENMGTSCYCSDYKELLKQKDIDAVIIATPDQIHPEQTIAALEAGKHVLCEKPMALTAEECKAMIDASRKTGKKLMIGQICRYTPGFRLAKKMIDEGVIGELFFVESEYAHDYTHITGAENWRLDPVRLRHPFLGGGCHPVDLLRWVAGDPYEVTAYASKKVLQSWPVDDCTIAILRFPKNVLGKVFVSIGCKRAYTMRSAFYGNQGTIIADNTSPYISVYKNQICSVGKAFESIGTVQEESISMDYPVDLNSHNAVDEVNEFIDTIVHNREILTDGVQGASTVAACLAAVESAALGKSVRIEYGF